MVKVTPAGGNIFLDLGFDADEAANLKIRSNLIIALMEIIRHEKLTQAEAAELLGVTQPRASNLMNARIELFSIDMLVKMLAAVGRRVEVEVLPDGNSNEA